MSSKFYTVAGGIKLFFQEGTGGAAGLGYRDLGNLVNPSIGSEITKLEHYTSRSGQRQKDKTNVQQSAITINFRFDEPNEFNLRWAFLGGTMTAVSAGSVTITRELVQLEDTTAKAVALTMASSPNVIIEAISGIPMTYTVTTDYTIDQANSTITRVGGGAIADGEFVMVTYDAQLPAHNKFPVLESPILSGAARLIMLPTTGQQLVWDIPSVTLAPDGEFTLDDQDWAAIDMVLDCLADTTNNPTQPYGSVRTWNVE